MEQKKLIQLILICLFAGATIVVSISVATNNRSKLKVLEEQSKDREQQLLDDIDSLNQVTSSQAKIITERDCTIFRREIQITEMLDALHSDDKKIKDSLKKIPIDKILEDLRK